MIGLRIMAIDYGDARTGVAISDPTGLLAGFTTVIHSRKPEAVGCTDRAKTNRALPPVFPAIILQALPRPGRHASGLPRKP